LHIIEDIQVIILKKENKEKGSVQTGLLLATGEMQDSK
jgi:hypothetical protein